MNDIRRHPFEDPQLVMTLLPLLIAVISAVVVHVSWMTRGNFPQFRSSTCIIQPKFTSSRLGLAKFLMNWTVFKHSKTLSSVVHIRLALSVCAITLSMAWVYFGLRWVNCRHLPLSYDVMQSRLLSLNCMTILHRRHCHACPS